MGAPQLTCCRVTALQPPPSAFPSDVSFISHAPAPEPLARPLSCSQRGLNGAQSSIHNAAASARQRGRPWAVGNPGYLAEPSLL